MKTRTKSAIIFILFLVLIIPILSYGAKVAGTVIAKQGEVKVLHQGETEWKDILLRSKVYEKDIIETKANSKVKILFLDESLMNIGENSKMEITEQNYEPGKKRVSVYNVLAGKVRILVGKVSGEESKFEVRTPTALAAVRGTELFVWVKSATVTQVFVISVEPDKEVSVENLQIPGVAITVSENFATLVEEGAPPTQPAPATIEQIQQLFKDTSISGDATSPGGGPGGGTGGGGTGGGTSGESVGTGEGGTGEVKQSVDTSTGGGGTGGAYTGGGTGGGGTGGGTGQTGGDSGTIGQGIIQSPAEGQTGGSATPPGTQEKPKGKIIIKF